MVRLLLMAACGSAILFVGVTCRAEAQTSGPLVSIVPHLSRSPVPSSDTQAFHIQVDSSLVLIPVHATTLTGAAITTNLTVDNFRLFEDGAEQRIASFSSEDAPLSVGLVFDASGSMGRKMQVSAAAAEAFLKTTNPGDEFFLIEFAERPRLAVSFTSDSDQIYKKIAAAHPFGRTSLVDALQLAVLQMKRARHSRKAILILSDGGDNHSRFSFREMRNMLIESDVQVFAMGIFDRDISHRHTVEEEKGPDLLRDLAEQTGGLAYTVDSFDQLPAISALIGKQLRDQYVVGYSPTNNTRDGKYRKIKLDLLPPEGFGNLKISYRRGYYAPTE
jgi:Ca-activated chloride channel homolog